MYEGEIVQIGTPVELFERPRHTFVGYFIGSPGMNFLPARVSGAAAFVGERQIALAGAPMVTANANVERGVRPEFVDLDRGGPPIQITTIEDVGRQKIVRATFKGHPLTAVVEVYDEIPADP